MGYMSVPRGVSRTGTPASSALLSTAVDFEHGVLFATRRRVGILENYWRGGKRSALGRAPPRRRVLATARARFTMLRASPRLTGLTSRSDYHDEVPGDLFFQARSTNHLKSRLLVETVKLPAERCGSSAPLTSTSPPRIRSTSSSVPGFVSCEEAKSPATDAKVLRRCYTRSTARVTFGMFLIRPRAPRSYFLDDHAGTGGRRSTRYVAPARAVVHPSLPRPCRRWCSRAVEQ
jgi:hypothetical protein